MARTAAKSSSKLDAPIGVNTKLDTNADSKSSSNPAPVRAVNSSPAINSLPLNSKSAVRSNDKSNDKSDDKPDAKPVTNSVTAPVATPARPASVVTTTLSSLSTYPASTSLLATFLTTSPTTSRNAAPTTSNPATAPASNLAAPSNQQPLAQQLTVSPASVTALSTPTLPQPVAIPPQIAVPGKPLSSGTPGASSLAPSTAPSAKDQPNPTLAVVTTSTVPFGATILANALSASNSSKAADALPSISSTAPANSPRTTEASPASPELSVVGQAASDAAHSLPTIATLAVTVSAQSSIPPAPVSQMATLALPKAVLPTPVSPFAATISANALSASNISEVADALPSTSSAVNAYTGSPVTTDAGPTSPEPPVVGPAGQAASDAAHSFLTIATQSVTAAIQSSIPPGQVLQMTTAPVLPTAVLPTPVSPLPATAVLPTPVQTVSLTSPVSVTAPPTSATPFTKTAPSSLPSSTLDQPLPSSAQNPSLASSTTPASNVIPLTFSAPTQTLTPTPAQIPTPTSAPTTPFPTQQSIVSDRSSAPVTEPPIATQSTALQSSTPQSSAQSSDPKVSSSALVNSRPGATAAEPTPISGSATVDAAPARALSVDATTAAAQTANATETGFDVADNIPSNPANNTATNNVSNPANLAASDLTASNLGASNLTLNSNGAAPTPASLAASASDAAGGAKPGFSAQPDLAADSPTTEADKKSSAVVQPNATTTSAIAAQTVPAAFASGMEPSVTLTASAPPAAAPATQAAPDSAPNLPQTHQMLDSAPPAPPSAPAAPIAPDSPAAVQMNAQMNANAQMHVGIRTDAFGSVEIHTVVQQSQIGITVQSDRDIARWFSSEVPSLESGLNQSHLNLTGVNFDNARSGLQTATSSHHGQSQQQFSETPSYTSAARPNTLSEDDTALESATVDILPAGQSVGPALTRVSIHA